MVQKLGFIAMIQSLFGVIGTMATAINRYANAVNNIGEWAEESSAAFVDEAKDDRALKTAQRKAEFRKELEAMKAQGIDVTDVTPKAIG